jgi:hypothetical protein
MATDPFEALNRLNPLRPQETQPRPTETQAPAPRPAPTLTPTQSQSQPSPDRFTRALDSLDRMTADAEARRLRETPDDTARRNKVAKELGILPSDVFDLAQAEKAAGVKRFMELRKANPLLDKVMEQYPFAAPAAVKEVKPLEGLAAAFDFIKKVGPRTVETGTLSLAKMMSSAVALMSNGKPVASGPAGFGAATNALMLMEQPLENMTERSRKRYGSSNYYAEGMLQGTESVVLTLGAMATGNAIAGAAVLGGLVGLDSARDAQKKGMSAGEIALYGTLHGGSEALFEMIPMGELLKVGGRGFISGAGRYLLAEMPSELATTAVQSFTDWAMLPENADKTFKDWTDGLPEEMAQTALGVLGGGTVTVTTAQSIAKVGQFMQRRETQRQMAAIGKFEGDMLTRFGNQIGNMALRKEDPAAFAELMREWASDAGVSTVLIDGTALRQYFQSEAYDPQTDPLAQYEQAAEEAALAGNDVAIPVETALTTLPATAGWNALKDDMRFTAGGMSKRQADEFEANEEAVLAEFQEIMGESDTRSRKEVTAREAMISQVQTKLVEDAMFAPQEAQRLAELQVARMTTRAARMGRDAAAVQKALDGLTVRQVLPPELARAVAADERDMVIRALRGNEKGTTSRARAAAKELETLLTKRGWTPKDLTDDQIGEMVERLQQGGQNAGREFRSERGAGQPAGDGRYAALDGATKVAGETFGPIPAIVDAADAYAAAAGIELRRQARFAEIDEEFSRRLAEAYEEMEHAPNDPAVAEAYAAMIEQAMAQYQVLVDAGFTFTFYDADTSPYGESPFNAIRDLRDNKHMAVFSTAPLSEDAEGASYGSDITDLDVSDNPMLADTGLQWADQNGVMHPVLANDIFRAVHDAFGHGLEGAGFRAKGEENAWQAHARLFTGPALAALTSETRGQNSWVNFGPFAGENATALQGDTTYADQKTGLLPAWAWTENVVPDMEPRNEQDATQQSGRSGSLFEQGASSVDERPSYPRLERPPVNEDGTITLDHFSLEKGLTQTDPKAWGRSSKLLPDSERARIGTAPARTYFGIATERGGYFNEFGGGRHPRFRTPVERVTARIPADRLYDMYGDPDGLKEIGRALPKNEQGKYIYKGKPVDGVSLYELLIRDAGYAGYWTPVMGLTAAVFEPVEVVPYDAARDDYVPTADEVRGFNQSGWHGSPHLFNRFSTDFIGTGEGAQAFGWGLYFSGMREVAEFYKSALSGQQIVFMRNGERRVASKNRIEEIVGDLGLTDPFEAYPAELAIRQITLGMGLDEAIEFVRGEYPHFPVDSVENGLMRVREADPKLDTQGRIYEVEIPEDHEFMDWDRPVADQSPLVQKALARIGIVPASKPDLSTIENSEAREIIRRAIALNEGEFNGLAMIIDNDYALYKRAQALADKAGLTDVDIENYGGTGFYILEALAPQFYEQAGEYRRRMTGAHVYMKLQRELGSDRLASEMLLRLGIAGNRYKSGTFGSNVPSKEGFNYVVFDDRRVEVRSFEQATVFYSALERAVELVKADRAPAAQWIATLKNAGGVKAEELEWSGLIDWLNVQTAQVDKSQVIEFLQRGGIVIEEVLLESDARMTVEEVLETYQDEIWDRTYQLASEEFDSEYEEEVEVISSEEEGGADAYRAIIRFSYTTINVSRYNLRTKSEFEDYENDDAADWMLVGTFASEEEARSALSDARSDVFEYLREWDNYEEYHREEAEREYLDRYADADTEGNVKWKEYSLAESDDDTYFEWLMRLPSGQGRNPNSSPRTHWDQSGVVIHVRGHKRTGSDGKRILFLDEIQSDWHQQAASRFTDAKAEAVRNFMSAYINNGERDRFGDVPADVVEGVRNAVAEGKAHRAWPDLAKWLEVNPSEAGALLLQAVADANRGYLSPPDPARIAQAELAEAAAKEALELTYDPMVLAIAEVQASVTPAMEARLVVLQEELSEAEKRREQAEREAAEFRKDGDGTFDGEKYREMVADYRATASEVERIQRAIRAVEMTTTRTSDKVSLGDIRAALMKAEMFEEEQRLIASEPYANAVKERAAWDAANNLLSLRERELAVLKSGGGGIPDAPFKDTWPAVAMKRMIAKAAAEGYDQIAWIKQGENNGGMNDDVDWFYGRNLPNMVNKLLKPYKVKTTPLYVSGLKAAETPALQALENTVEKLRKYEIGVALGISREGFDEAVEKAEATLEAEIEAFAARVTRAIERGDGYDQDLYTRRGEEERRTLEELRQNKDALKAEWFDAVEAYVPNLEATDNQIRAAGDRMARAKQVAGWMNNYRGIGKEALRERMEKSLEAARERIEQQRRNIEFNQKAISAIEAAMAAGEAEVKLEGVDYPVSATQGRIENHQDRLKENNEDILRLEGQMAQIDPSRFDEQYDALLEVQGAEAELRALNRERERLLQQPTNLGFDITPELREAARSGFPLFQGDHRNTPRGRVLFPRSDDQGAVIELFEGRDLSTLIHEGGHIWLEEMKADAADPDAPQQIRDDYQAILDFFRQNGFEVRDGVIPVGAHELFARSMERYAREGKAPSLSLRRAFESFREWLVNIYRTVAGLNAPITPEIREVFDRMLATDAEIAEARATQGMEALFNDATEAGMSESAFANYQEQVANARAEAAGRVLEKVMADIAAREKRLGKERRKEIRAKVTEAIEEQPLFRALALLRENRMDRAMLVEQFGEEALSGLPTRVPPLYSESGVDPEVIAEQAGFQTAADMIAALTMAEAEQRAAKESGDKRNLKRRTIEEATDRAMQAQFGEAVTEEQIREEALDAVANERQAEVVAAEIGAVGRKIGRPPTPYQVAKNWARTRVRQGTFVAEASKQALQRHRRAIEMAAREAEKAMLAGNMEEVYRAKQKQMLSMALLAEAKAANQEIEVARARMERIAKARTMKSVDQDYLEQAHALLEEVDLKRRTGRSMERFDSWSDWAAQRRAEGHEVMVPDNFMAMIGNTNWTRLTVEQLLGLDEAVRQVMHFGKLKKGLMDNQKRRDFEDIKREIKEQADIAGRKEPVSDFKVKTWWDAIKGQVASLDAALLKAETLFDWMDNGNPEGVFNRLVFRPIAQAAARENVMLRDFYERHKAHLEALPAGTVRSWATKITAPFTERKTGLPMVLTRQQVVAMALNWGNEGNRQRLADGYGLNQIGLNQFLMDTLTAEEWQFVQNTWDLIGELWPEIAAMERRVNGVEPDKVEAITFATPFGQMRGGYYPAIYNSQADRKAQYHSELDTDLFSAMTTKATTKASSTKERSEAVKRPILLELGVITRHVSEVIHDITHREVVIQANRILSDPEVLDEFDAVLGREYSDQLRPWVKYIANRWAYERAGNEGFTRFMGKMRANATVVGLGWRFSTMMMQLSGYSNSIEVVGAQRMTEAVFNFVRNPFEATEFVRDKSPEMRVRFDTIDRDINREITLAMQPSVVGGTIQTAGLIKTFAFHGIGALDLLVSVPTWMAGYNRALERGASEEQAIYEGDKAVRQSQGNADTKDLAAIQRGTGTGGEFMKALTMFYSYMSAYYQRQRGLGRDTARAFDEGDIAAFPALLARAWWLIIVPPLLSQLLAGRGPDDDEDPALWAFEEIISQMLGPIPIVRDVWSPAFKRATGQPSFGYKMTPAQGAFDTTVNVAGDLGRVARGEETKRMTRNTLELLGYSTGMMTGQIAASTQFLVDVSEGDQQPRSGADWFEGLTKGKIKED